MEELRIINIYMTYMWNEFDYFQCSNLFDERSEHIFDIWVRCREEAGFEGAPAAFWAKVDNDIKEIILDHIMQ